MATEGDSPRLLATRSELGYTASAIEALPDEPEAVTEEEQRELTARANRTWTARRRDAWGQTSRTIERALDDFEATISGDRGLEHAVRNVRRTADAVGRKLAG